MDLCNFCEGIIATLCNDLHHRSNLVHKDYFVPLKGLVQRSTHCHLCRLVDHCAAEAFGDATRSFYSSNTQFGIVPMRSYPDDAESPLTEIMLISRPSGPEFRIAIWASPGNHLFPEAMHFSACYSSNRLQVAPPPCRASSVVINHCSTTAARRPFHYSERGSRHVARATRTAKRH
jgi:hypothetical protein